MNKAELEQRALLYAERYGICDYDIKGTDMIYYVSYRAYLQNPRYTIKHTVNLFNYKENTVQLKRYNVRGERNR